ncbi:sensor histidine kinase [Leptolyngbya sp. AN02str]|uniref:sensor histidine kinase n=1 Tax=Leptolyngbya sp. AN02str TaxID=3423363 RepID=UPI003D31E843
MMEPFKTLFSAQGYIPHGHCYLWKPQLVWLHVLSNGAIAVAYFSIPVLLVYFIRRRKDVPFNGVFMLFGAFIVACGLGHVMDIWTIWHPTYWLTGVIKALTAIISIYTAIELIPLIPKALALPSPAQLEAANRDLAEALQHLQQTQTQLIQTEKMSTLGQLVAGIAHEINNPVNFIYGNLSHVSDYTEELLALLQTYQHTYPQPESPIKEAIAESDLSFIQTDLPKILASIRLGADRIRQLVLSLRNFSRMDAIHTSQVNVHDLIDSTLLILQPRLRPKAQHLGIQLVKNYGNLPAVECYPGQLNQVLMNLLCNAIDAIEQQAESQAIASDQWMGTITVQTQMIDASHVELRIGDTGPGIAADVKSRIFDVFFTTKPVGKGTGMGLAISRQVIERHQGTLVCESQPGQGTQFIMTFPIRLPAVAPAGLEAASSVPGTVLSAI